MRKNIEDPAKPILTALIKGDALRLSPDQQQRIATWAALKAMVAEYDHNSWVTTHHTHRKYLMRKYSPPLQSWAVWIGAYKRNRWSAHWISSPFLYDSPKQEARRGSNIAATYYNSHISTQVIGELFIQVIRSPSRSLQRWRFSPPDKGTLFRIWPPSEVSINWPGKVMSDRDADYVAGAMYFFLLEVGRKSLAARGVHNPLPSP
jgi:hypothetical protein